MRTLSAKPVGNRREHVPVSPVIPGTGVVLLALLWLLSAFDGWAAAAFCSGGDPGGTCHAQVTAAIRPSGVVAAVAAVIAGAALLAPSVVRSVPTARAARLWLLVASVVCWVLALAVLFVAGKAAGT
ncbi:MAG: hypothetical protein ACM3ML_03880 [Micromonosporaceae bacterium]